MTKKKSKRIIQISLLFSTAISMFFVPWIFLRIWLTPLPSTVQEQVDDAINYGLDGIIVYVERGNKTPEYYTAGWKNRENQVPASPNDLFKIASISKLYIAAACVKLVNKQLLSLDKTLAEYLPELKAKIPNADRITLRMMIQHRSGIANFVDHPDFPWGNPPKTNNESLQFALEMPADFEPGTRYKYSNTNYLLLGQIIDKTLGYSHHRYIKEEILQPLGLEHTFSLLSEVNPADVMSGYSVGYDKDLKLNNYVAPGGSMIATIGEVGIFLRALIDGTLFNENEQAIYSSVYSYEHTGLLPGYSSIARYHKDIDAVVIQFVNTSGGKSWTVSEIVYKRIVRILTRTVQQ